MREFCTSGSVGGPGGQPPGSTRHRTWHRTFGTERLIMVTVGYQGNRHRGCRAWNLMWKEIGADHGHPFLQDNGASPGYGFEKAR